MTWFDALVGALVAALPQEPADPVEIDLRVNVRDAEARDPVLDIVANHVPMQDVLLNIARGLDLKLSVKAGEAELRLLQPVQVHLRERRLGEVLPWLGAVSGLQLRTSNEELKVAADITTSSPPEELLRRALAHYRVLLVEHVDHVEAPRLRFEVANIHFQLGELHEALREYNDLLRLYPGFADASLVYFRRGHAYALSGDDNMAVDSWMTLVNSFDGSALVAPAYLECVRSFRRLGYQDRADLALRHVVETLRSNLSMKTVVDAGWLLHEGGDHDRAIIAFQRVLHEEAAAELHERSLAGLIAALEGIRAWPALIEAVARYVARFPSGPGAPSALMSLAAAHRALDDRSVSLMALKRATELGPPPDLQSRIHFLEGEILEECGMAARALHSYFQAGLSPFSPVALEALRRHAALSLSEGFLHQAMETYERLAAFPEAQVEGSIGKAEVALLQRNTELSLELIQQVLPAVTDTDQKARLLELAAEAYRRAPVRPGPGKSPGPETEESS